MAEVQDLADFLGRDLGADLDEVQAQKALDHARVIVITYVGTTNVDNLPIVEVITIQVAARLYANPTALKMDAVAGNSEQYADAYLTTSERRLLDVAIRGPRRRVRLFTVSTTRGDV